MEILPSKFELFIKPLLSLLVVFIATGLVYIATIKIVGYSTRRNALLEEKPYKNIEFAIFFFLLCFVLAFGFPDGYIFSEYWRGITNFIQQVLYPEARDYQLLHIFNWFSLLGVVLINAVVSSFILATFFMICLFFGGQKISIKLFINMLACSFLTLAWSILLLSFVIPPIVCGWYQYKLTGQINLLNFATAIVIGVILFHVTISGGIIKHICYYIEHNAKEKNDPFLILTLSFIPMLLLCIPYIISSKTIILLIPIEGIILISSYIYFNLLKAMGRRLLNKMNPFVRFSDFVKLITIPMVVFVSVYVMFYSEPLSLIYKPLENNNEAVYQSQCAFMSHSPYVSRSLRSFYKIIGCQKVANCQAKSLVSEERVICLKNLAKDNDMMKYASLDIDEVIALSEHRFLLQQSFFETGGDRNPQEELTFDEKLKEILSYFPREK